MALNPSLLPLSTGSTSTNVPIYSHSQETLKAARSLGEKFKDINTRVGRTTLPSVSKVSLIDPMGKQVAESIATRVEKEKRDIHAFVHADVRDAERWESDQDNLGQELHRGWGPAANRAKKHVRKLTKYFSYNEE